MSSFAALGALLMLSFASVQSLLMEATMAPSGGMVSICGTAEATGTPSIALATADLQQAIAASHPERPDGTPHHHKAVCPYCAAASHVPVLTPTALVRQPGNSDFTPFRAALGDRPPGPRVCQPRVRGPPPRFPESI